ncbi:hypothetical protein JTB14_034878 [Gonioctena quinquepunctata]|nr:hypothetical protein JTB14_034878 [Gonioctena quinquepunctata]
MSDVFRCDRDPTTNNITKGGGVLLASRNSYRSLPISFSALRDTVPEVDIVDSKLVLGSFTLSVIVVYIPPCCSNIHYDFLQSSNPVTKGNLLLVDDFSIPKFDMMKFDRSHARKKLQVPAGKSVAIDDFESSYESDQKFSTHDSNSDMDPISDSEEAFDIIYNAAEEVISLPTFNGPRLSNNSPQVS